MEQEGAVVLEYVVILHVDVQDQTFSEAQYDFRRFPPKFKKKRFFYVSASQKLVAKLLFGGLDFRYF